MRSPTDVEQRNDDDEGDDPELAPERSWRERAEAVLPTGASTGSKRAEALYGDESRGRCRRTSSPRAAATSPTSTASNTSTARWRSAPSRSATPSRASRAPSSSGRAGQRLGALELARGGARRAAVRDHSVRRARAVPQDRRRGDVAAAVRLARTYTGARQVIALRLFRLARLVVRRRTAFPQACAGTVDVACRSTTSPRSSRGGGARARTLAAIVHRAGRRAAAVDEWIDARARAVRRAAARC